MPHGKRILMIDDDTNPGAMVKVVCEAKRFKFEAAYSASEGLNKIKETKPDLIILDVIMEDFVAGFRIVSKLRSSDPGSEYDSFANVPILMLTVGPSASIHPSRRACLSIEGGIIGLHRFESYDGDNEKESYDLKPTPGNNLEDL